MPILSRIDCHMHYMPSAIGDRLQADFIGKNAQRSMVGSRPAWRDLSVQRALMDRSGVALGIMLDYGSELMRGLRSLGGSLNEAVAAYNRSMSEDLSELGGRFLSAAVVDPFGGKAAIAGLERDLSLPAICGIGLVASYEGMALDDPLFEPIFELARDHDVPILVHPSSVADAWIQTLRLDDLFLRAGLGFFLDDALCILRMAVHGTFDRYPDVRFMFCQLGGAAPICCGRWEYHRDQARRMQEEREVPLPAWTDRPLSEYLSRLWLDTHTQDRHALALVLAEAGEHAVVLGGDYPYTPYEAAGGLPYALSELNALELSGPTMAAIEHENALRLLGTRGQAAFQSAGGRQRVLG